MSPKTIIKIAVLVATTMVLCGAAGPGCEGEVGPAGAKVKFTQAGPPDPRWVPMGYVEIDGHTYALIDTNGDGQPDMAYDQTTGKTYKITPIPNTKPANGTSTQPAGGGAATGDGKHLEYILNGRYVVYMDAGPEPEIQVDLPNSAEEGLEEAGLAQIVPGQTFDLDIVVNWYHDDGNSLDVSFPWSLELLGQLPNVGPFSYEWYTVPSETDPSVAWMWFRVAGRSSQVVAFLGRAGFTHLSTPYEEGYEVELTTHHAWVYRGGELVREYAY